MNLENVQGNWNEIKGKIHSKWGKITEDDLESLKGHLEQLAGKIQQVYGYTKEKAEKEFEDFKATLGKDSFKTGRSDDEDSEDLSS